MKNQYFGDINDFQKYALLRALARNGDAKLLVCWILTADDGRSDGARTAYLLDPDDCHSNVDAGLHRALRRLLIDDGKIAQNRRDVRWTEALSLIPGAAYYPSDAGFPQTRDALPLFPSDPRERSVHFSAVRDCAVGMDLVFLDPDIGLGPKSQPIGCAGSNRYVYQEEVNRVFTAGPAILVYQHFPRVDHSQFVACKCAELADAVGTTDIIPFVTDQVVFFLALHPGQRVRLGVDAAAQLGFWEEAFMRGLRSGTASGSVGVSSDISRSGLCARHQEVGLLKPRQ